MSNRDFCRFFRNGLVYNNNTSNFTISPCCYYNGVEGVETSKQINLARDHWLNADVKTVCRACIRTEHANLPSYRQSSFDVCSGKTDSIEFLTVTVNKTCNLACASCGSHSSSFWYQENQRNNQVDSPIIHALHDKTRLAESSQQFIELLKSQDLSQITFIKFGGGEPLMNDEHVRVMQLIPNPENVTIQYTSNFSIMPSAKAMELWNKFKLIKWCASTDGVEQQFEILRWPHTWSKFTNFVARAIDQVPGNVMFGVEHTLNPLNIYYYDRFEQWFNSTMTTNRYGDRSDFNLHTCNGLIGLIQTPPELRQLIAAKYGQDHAVTSILNVTEQNKSCRELIDYMDLLDQQRNTNWRNAFPEVEKYFNV